MKLYHYELRDDGLRLIQSLDTDIKINEKIVFKDEKHHARSKSKVKNNQHKK
jgi:hypothetical protein